MIIKIFCSLLAEYRRVQFFTQTLTWHRPTKHNIVLFASICICPCFPQGGCQWVYCCQCCQWPGGDQRWVGLLLLLPSVQHARLQSTPLREDLINHWHLLYLSNKKTQNLNINEMFSLIKALWNSLSWPLTELHSTRNVLNVNPAANLWTLPQSMNIKLSCIVNLVMTISSNLGYVNWKSFTAKYLPV